LTTANPSFSNILVIHFGQLGDVILSFPALRAIREEFPDARLTILAGKSASPLLQDFKFADEIISVDRVALLRDRKLRSIRKIFQLVGDVRRRRFDLVIDLHSLYETNILGYLSGAGHRLYANRESRSLDFLGNFRPRPEKEDKSKHLSDFYLAVLAPLGINKSKEHFRIDLERDEVESFLREYDVDDRRKIGFVVGAGHPSRRWPLECFAKLSQRISKAGNFQQFVFLGPEEEAIADEIKAAFGDDVRMVRGLNLYQLSAALSCLDLLVSNDTGPPHLAAIVGAPIVIVMDERAPLRYLPLSDRMRVINSREIQDISVEEVWAGVNDLLLTDNIAKEEEQSEESKSE
jgi:ADP-heptose:LPS heptosyltransferase